MRNLYVMKLYQECYGEIREVEPDRVMIADHLTRKDLRSVIEYIFLQAAVGWENDHMRACIYRNSVDGLYFKSAYNPELLYIIRSDTIVDGSTIDVYVTIEKPGYEPHLIRRMNIAS